VEKNTKDAHTGKQEKILNRDCKKLTRLWQEYIGRHEGLRNKAAEAAAQYFDTQDIRFLIGVHPKYLNGFDNWIIQLFQESLGSKSEVLSIKTLVAEYGKHIQGFVDLALADDCADPYLYIMNTMYYLQVFTAVLAYSKKINFVTQPHVEVYKKELKQLKNKQTGEPEAVSLDTIAPVIAKNLKPDHECIDCVLYCDAVMELRKDVREVLSRQFPEKIVSVFIGSDWNHHSYQAAFSDTATLYVIVLADHYTDSSTIMSTARLKENIRTLKNIGYATYTTIRDKAVYCALKTKKGVLDA
jgi:hypothetical protein